MTEKKIYTHKHEKDLDNNKEYLKSIAIFYECYGTKYLKCINFGEH